MRRLRTAYFVFGLTALLSFHILYTHNKIPYSFISLFLLSIAPAGYIYPRIFSYGLVILLWAAIYPFLHFVYKIDSLNSSLPVLISSALLLGFARYKHMLEAMEAAWSLRLKDEEDEKAINQAEYEKLDRFDKGIAKKELSIVNLYEITKRMSAGLRFEDVFGIFSGFLKDSFVFKRCQLMILKWQEGLPRLDRIYAVRMGEKMSCGECDMDCDRLIRIFFDDPKELCVSKDKDAHIFEELKIKDKAVETFMGIPLLSEKRVVAILTIENLPREELEAFAILSTQFALEIKKVLLYEAVEELAITDGLTGLMVRRYFLERFREEFNRSRRHGFKFAFLMADIDDFKKCNDTHGHLVGDVVLRDVARIIKENVREIDLVARYGGEEFALVLPETGREGARLAAERIRRKIGENIFRAYDEKLKVTISAGVSVYPEDSEELKDIIEKADKALYAAKNSGKNVVSEYKP